MSPRKTLALSLAHSLLAGPWLYAEQRARAIELLGGEPPWLRGVLVACRRRFGARPPIGEPSTLAGYLLGLPSFTRGVGDGTAHAHVVHPTLQAGVCSPPTGEWPAADFPELATVGELARWAELEPRALLWMAEPWRQRSTDGTPRALYTHRWIAKAHGGARLLEVPRPRLRRLQRRILDELLSGLPMHPAAHGFVPGRGVGTFAEVHAGRAAVLALDLHAFFASISRARVFRVFRAVGYPEQVARLLAGLCTHAVSRAVVRAAPGAADPRYGAPHLPQGAPTSPMLANLCALGLDVRLQALARVAGVTYARYADDLAFSGDAPFARAARRFTSVVARIAREEGFALNHRKTRLMRASQRQVLTGVVVNHRPTVSRAEIERLEATLFNCVRHGPAGENRAGHLDFRAHLLGRIGWVHQLRPGRAIRLRALFAQIRWT